MLFFNTEPCQEAVDGNLTCSKMLHVKNNNIKSVPWKLNRKGQLVKVLIVIFLFYSNKGDIILSLNNSWTTYNNTNKIKEIISKETLESELYYSNVAFS